MKEDTYYQPIAYFDDGTNVEYGDVPEGMYDFQVFPTREECENWLKNHGYNPGDFDIAEYHGDDVEDATFIDEYGNVIE